MLSLFPATCPICYQAIRYRDAICAACTALLPTHTDLCHYRQGVPVYAPFRYDDGIRMMIQQLKFQEQLIYSRVLGHLMRPYLQTYYANRQIDIVLPVPLHIKRLRQRGFNQALEIARYAFKPLKTKINRRSLQRTKHTKPQTNCNQKQRAGNVKNAFQLKHAISADHMVLFDDVITTGHTIAACLQACSITNIKRVDVWSVAIRH